MAMPPHRAGRSPRRAMRQSAPSGGRCIDDPKLDDLEERVAISNQNIVAAEANYRAAYALVLEAQSQLFPTFNLAPTVTREKTSAALAGIGGGSIGTSTGTTTTTGTTTGSSTAAIDGSTAPHNIFTLPLEASYQIDLWGSIRNTVAANRFSAQASAATLANALLSTQSTLAQDYFQLRVADEQRRILDTTVADYAAVLASRAPCSSKASIPTRTWRPRRRSSTRRLHKRPTSGVARAAVRARHRGADRRAARQVLHSLRALQSVAAHRCP